jgi:toxin-antitoxin system PIN domain toxin
VRALLDVNVLIAMLDSEHTSHSAAIDWFAANAAHGWASCPITQNGCLRIMSQPGYPGGTSLQDMAGRLRGATSQRAHEFWPDEVSMLDDRAIDLTRVHGPRQLTDTYLLSLAVHNKGRLVTFDRSIALSAVPGAKPRNLVVL